MKKGDKYPVTVQGISVGEAVVEYIDPDREEATFMIPGTRFIARYRTQLTDEGRAEDTSGTQTIVTGVDAPPVTPVDAPPPAEVTAPAAAPVANDNANAQQVVQTADATQQSAAPVVEEKPASDAGSN